MEQARASSVLDTGLSGGWDRSFLDPAIDDLDHFGQLWLGDLLGRADLLAFVTCGVGD